MQRLGLFTPLLQRVLATRDYHCCRMVSAQPLLKAALPLVPRANKPITTAELLKRLTDLSNQLVDTSQDNAAVKGQLERTIAPQLVDKNLLQHKDKGVRSYVAVCIIETLRICAPDAPFNASQLKVLCV